MMHGACPHVPAVRCYHFQNQEQALGASRGRCLVVRRLKETAPLSYFSGHLDIGKQMKIGVKVTDAQSPASGPMPEAFCRCLPSEHKRTQQWTT